MDWVSRVWKRSDKVILDKAAEINPPFKGSIEKSILHSMLALRREGKDQSAQVLQRVNRRSARKQTTAIVRELFEDDDDYEEVVAAYLVISTQLGDDIWNEKVKVARNVIIAGYASGWGLNDHNVYLDDAGNVVSALEATGRAGGIAKLKSGYRQVIKTPGVMTQLREGLKATTGWQLDRMIRTEATRVYNQGIVSTYAKDNVVAGYEFVAIVDSKTTDRCLMLDGTIIAKDDPRLYELTPPIHINCRSSLSPVFVFDERIASTVDTKVTRTLEDRKGKEYSLTYTPSRVMPMSVEGKLTRAGLGRENLMTVAESEVRRKGFTPPTPDELRNRFLGRRNDG